MWLFMQEKISSRSGKLFFFPLGGVFRGKADFKALEALVMHISILDYYVFFEERTQLV